MTARPVSIVICTQNRANELLVTLECVREQVYPASDIEIIVVDNHSTDDTCQVVERYALLPGIPIHYVYEPRIGITPARNRGMQSSHYPYLAYLDDDCSVDERWLAHLMSGFDLDDQVVAVFGQVINDWNGQKRPAWVSSQIDTWLGTNSFLGDQSRILKTIRGIRECNLAVNKEVLSRYGGFLGMEQFGSRHMSAGEMAMFLNQVKKAGGEIGYVPPAVAFHHVNPRSRTWMFRRAFWSGVSAGVINAMIERRKFWEILPNVFLDFGASIVLFFYSLLNFVALNDANFILYMMRSIRRLGLMLCELHLIGDWHKIRSWLAEQTA